MMCMALDDTTYLKSEQRQSNQFNAHSNCRHLLVSSLTLGVALVVRLVVAFCSMVGDSDI